jgi:hypothetical protein
LLGGLLIAIGLLTRFAAVQLAFQFFVISFLWYDEPAPIVGMYYQQLFFWVFVAMAFGGAGRFSADHIIRNKQIATIRPTFKPMLAAMLALLCLNACAQRSPLNGNGQIVRQQFDFNNFDKLELNDLHGKINVQIGQPFAIETNVDGNLQPLLSVTKKDDRLVIAFKGNANNRLYIENTNIIINISMPEIAVLEHNGNSNLVVQGLVGRYCRIENSNNGNALLQGSIDELDIIKTGNGNVDAQQLVAKKAAVQMQGNGSVAIFTLNSFKVSGSGNGNLTHFGSGQITTGSFLGGNASIINGNATSHHSKQDSSQQTEKVMTTIVNKGNQYVELTVRYPKSGVYGIGIPANQSVQESFPIGTKIYKGGQITFLKKPVIVITAANQKDSFAIH